MAAFITPLVRFRCDHRSYHVLRYAGGQLNDHYVKLNSNLSLTAYLVLNDSTLRARSCSQEAPCFVGDEGGFMHSNAFQPEELSAVKAVYDDIVAQEWFDQSEEAKASFGRYLIETYSLELIEPARFRTIVECSARTHYSRKR